MAERKLFNVIDNKGRYWICAAYLAGLTLSFLVQGAGLVARGEREQNSVDNLRDQAPSGALAGIQSNANRDLLLGFSEIGFGLLDGAASATCAFAAMTEPNERRTRIALETANEPEPNA